MRYFPFGVRSVGWQLPELIDGGGFATLRNSASALSVFFAQRQHNDNSNEPLRALLLLYISPLSCPLQKNQK